ncbi:class I SAM-dependent methyltransferase [Candidatus Margulisiibacteriota bacterium]
MANSTKATPSSLTVYGQRAFSVKSREADKRYWSAAEYSVGGGYFPRGFRNLVQQTLKPLLPETGELLDLMAGRYSYVERKPGRTVHGIGLVKRSLELNAALDSFEVQNLNTAMAVASKRSFDVILISFGLPYLTCPLEVLSSVRDHLKPDGRLLATYSTTTYVPEKAPAIWNEPKGFGFRDKNELVKDYLTRSGFKPPSPDKVTKLNYFVRVTGQEIKARLVAAG